MAFPFHLDLLVGWRLVALDLIVVNLQSEVQSEVRLSPHKTGLWCKWLSCGIGKLFSCFLLVKKVCKSCGLNLNQHDSRDEPIFFVMSVVGFVIIILAMSVKLSYEPAYWFYLAVWVPVILISTIGLLRPIKGIIIGLQYKYRVNQNFEN